MLLHLALLATLVQQEPKGTGTIVLRAARVIDGTGAAPIQNGVVVVTDDRIVAVGAAGLGYLIGLAVQWFFPGISVPA